MGFCESRNLQTLVLILLKVSDCAGSSNGLRSHSNPELGRDLIQNPRGRPIITGYDLRTKGFIT